MSNNLESATYHASGIQLYRLIVKLKKDESIHPQVARAILADSMSCFGTWQVVGITQGALALFEKTNFQSRPAGLHRAHLVPRKKTYDALLEGNIKEEELANFLAPREKTVICLRNENANICKGKCYAIDPKDGRFRPLHKGFDFHSEREGIFLTTLSAGAALIDVQSLL